MAILNKKFVFRLEFFLEKKESYWNLISINNLYNTETSSYLSIKCNTQLSKYMYMKVFNLKLYWKIKSICMILLLSLLSVMCTCNKLYHWYIGISVDINDSVPQFNLLRKKNLLQRIKLEYKGYLMVGHHGLTKGKMYICVDSQLDFYIKVILIISW